MRNFKNCWSAFLFFLVSHIVNMSFEKWRFHKEDRKKSTMRDDLSRPGGKVCSA